MSRRGWAVGLLAGALVLAGAGLAAPRLLPGVLGPCGEDVEHLEASESGSPFLDAEGREEQPDPDREAVVAALERAPAPFGEVLGAVGYHYDQWARVGGFAQGLGVRTRDNPDFTMLDDTTLEPLWSVRVTTARSAYDASAERYVVATLPDDAAPDLVAMDAGTGERVWCATLGERAVGQGDPFATYVLDDGDVVALTPAEGDRDTVTRLSGRDGRVVWQRTVESGAGDVVDDLGGGRLVVGGRPQSELFEEAALASRAEGPSLVALSARDGTVAWTREATARSDVHVLGTDRATGTVVLLERVARTGSVVVKALGREGDQRWYAVPARGAAFDATLRSGRVLVRAGSRWSAYAVEDGHRLWTRVHPDRPQFLPYGFQLASIPMLDADHALVGGTDALHVLDLRTGALRSTSLPTDGISTTYWPYELAATAGLIAVATNTGAVVVRRE